MRALLLLVLALPTVAAAWPGVHPEALVYVPHLKVNDAGESFDPPYVEVPLASNGREQEGWVEVEVRLRAEAVGVWTRRVLVDLGQGTDGLTPLNVTRFEWPPASAGRSAFAIEVSPARRPDVVWDRVESVIVAGHAGLLEEGFGRVYRENVTTLDLTGEGREDLAVADGTPLRWVEATATPWRDGSLQGYRMELAFEAPAAERTAFTLRLDKDALRDILRIAGARPVRVETTPGLAHEAAQGEHVLAFEGGAQPVVHRAGFWSSFVVHQRAGLDDRTWADGYRNVLVASGWDLDNDGREDVRFFEADATDAETAHGLPADARRATPLTLRVEAHVVHGGTSRRLDLLLERPDKAPAWAWVEVVDEGAIRRRLGFPGAPLVVDLEGAAALVPAEGGTWVWLGEGGPHRVGFVAHPPKAPPDVPEPPPTPRAIGLPSALAPLALLAAAASWRRGPPRRRGPS